MGLFRSKAPTPEPPPAAPRGHVEKCVPCGGKGWWISPRGEGGIVGCTCDHGSVWVVDS